MTTRARSFGAVATAYERFRPAYPDELADRVLSYAGRPVRTALEIGAGTGKATRLFAERDIAVTACDPDAAMLAELRRHVPANATTFHGPFEELPSAATYDLVFAAASLHWTEPAHRWVRIAAILPPGGVFASFGGQLRLVDDDLARDVSAARATLLADDDIPSPEGTPHDSGLQWPGSELETSDLFTDVRQTVIARRATLSAAEYIGQLSTISAYLELSPKVRDKVFRRIHGVLPERVSTISDITLHLACKR